LWQLELELELGLGWGLGQGLGLGHGHELELELELELDESQHGLFILLFGTCLQPVQGEGAQALHGAHTPVFKLGLVQPAKQQGLQLPPNE